MSRQKKRSPATEIKPIDVLSTMRVEIAEAVELMRPQFPADDEAALRHRAEGFRSDRYSTGQWPDFAQIAKDEAIIAEEDEAKIAAIMERHHERYHEDE
jgi:hypothetical protein